MGNINKILYINLLILITQFTFCAKNGLVIAPVADLVGQPLGCSDQSYQQLPWAARGSDYAACPRVHQLLFNETLEIIEKRGDEIKVRVPNLFYQTTKSNTPQTDYWTLAANIRDLDAITKKECAKIPAPISFKKPIQPNTQPIATLISPYYDRKTKMSFSAGTRFVCTPRAEKKARVAVYRFNPNRGVHETVSLPKNLLYQSSSAEPDQQRANFVHILQQWAHTPGTIPYVWGGCSFTEAHRSNQFTAISTKKGGYYTRPERKKIIPKTGFDCAGIIVRAAQIVGLPYFLKNSYTIARNLPLLQANEHLQAGDIIWIPGHVIVVSDIKNNLVVEAHAYGSGYGKVHELSISRIFKDIQTFEDLETAFRAQTTLHRLNSNGKVFATYQQFKLLTLAHL